jgi:hypothetical protein
MRSPPSKISGASSSKLVLEANTVDDREDPREFGELHR